MRFWPWIKLWWLLCIVDKSTFKWNLFSSLIKVLIFFPLLNRLCHWQPVPVFLSAGFLWKVLPIWSRMQSGQRNQRLQKRRRLWVSDKTSDRGGQWLSRWSKVCNFPTLYCHCFSQNRYRSGLTVVRCSCPPNYNGSLCEFRREFIPSKGMAYNFDRRQPNRSS